MEELREEILGKIGVAMRFKKYREALMTSINTLDLENVLDDPSELEMFVTKPGEEFYSFVTELENFLKEIALEVSKK